MIPIFTWLAVAVLAVLALRGRLNRDTLLLCGSVGAGLAIDAVIFGGLSAPVDRYQSRIVWLLPALLAVWYAADRTREDKPVID